VTVATGLLDHPSLAADRWARSGPATLYVAGDYFGRGGAELLVMSERLTRRRVARGHGLAYDLNE
jgi:hypothetical protein